MSEDDRAAKAARAKALLKKRQQQKAASSGVETPPRTFSPAPTETIVEGIRDLGHLFSDTEDTSWLSLPHTTSPSVPQLNATSAGSPSSLGAPLTPAQSAQAAPSPVAALEKRIEILSKHNETLTLEISRAAQQADALLDNERRRVEDLKESCDKLRNETATALASEKRTVALLVSEKAHLTSQLEKLESIESNAQTLEDLLEAERRKVTGLDEKATRLQVETKEFSWRVEQSKIKEKELWDHNKELERQLQVASASAADSRKTADDLQRRLRDLEEQIQADDRVERLEQSLKHTRDRADELEFQLTKVKQANTVLRSDREGHESTLQEYSNKELEWTSEISSLKSQLESADGQLSNLETERDRLFEDKSKLQSQLTTNDTSNKDLRAKLAEATSAVASLTRQLQHNQNELKHALRRAEDAENTQQNLQAEGTNLMRSLDEMRPKIVELTGAKVDLMEKVENLERALRNRDSTIIQLENDLGEVRDNLELVEQVWKEKVTHQEKQYADAQDVAADMQKAYSELQEELGVALASLRNLEVQRSNHHQDASRHLEVNDRLSRETRMQEEELNILKRELEATRKSHNEEQIFLERAQNEIEALRSELSAREEEITQLREMSNTPVSAVPRSLEDELLGSMRQQHVLELSAATSQIRALENTIFDKDSDIHLLQKRINDLEDEMNQQSSSIRFPPRPTSRASNRNEHSWITSSPQLNLPSPLARTVFDQAITPETLHKRKVSLTMLKARLDSEARATINRSVPRALSPVHSDGQTDSRPSSVASHYHGHRSQFMDDAHVFWCHSCSGDLVIL